MKKRNSKKLLKRQRLVDIEIDEISLVDKPAIAEEFIITKRVTTEGKGNAVKKKNKGGRLDVTKTLALADKWKIAAKKAKDESETCLISGKTRKEASLGFISGIGFEAAVEHGIADELIKGTFDLDAFKEENAELFTKAEGDDDGETEETETKKDKDKKEGEDEESEDEAESEDDEAEDEESEDEAEDDEAEDEGGDAKGKKKTTDEVVDEVEDVEAVDADTSSEGVAKRLVALEKENVVTKKNLDKVQELLSASLDFHEQAALVMSEAVALTLGALEGVMMLMQSNDETSAAVQQCEDVDAEALSKKITKFRTNIQKAGAKISASRLGVLRDIAEKLSALIESVASEKAKGSEKGGKTKTTKSAKLESLEQQFAELKKSVEGMDGVSEILDVVKKGMTDMASRLDEVEASVGGVSDAGDDDSDDSDESDEADSGSVFKGFGPLSDVAERIEKRTRVSTKS